MISTLHSLSKLQKIEKLTKKKMKRKEKGKSCCLPSNAKVPHDYKASSLKLKGMGVGGMNPAQIQ